MKRNVLSKEQILASLPIAIYIIGLIVSWLWSPVMFHRLGYSIAALMLLVIFVVGAAWGIAQRLPLWSYSWVIFAIWSISSLVQASMAESATSAINAGVVISLMRLSALFVVIIIASFLSFRGMRFAIFAILLSLLYGALHFPILEGIPILPEGTARIATSVFGTLAVAEAVIAVFAVVRFLSSQGKLQTRPLYLLAAIIFVDPLLNGCSFSLTMSGVSFLETVIPAVSTVAFSWVAAGLTLLLGWGFSKLTLRLMKSGQHWFSRA